MIEDLRKHILRNEFPLEVVSVLPRSGREPATSMGVILGHVFIGGSPNKVSACLKLRHLRRLTVVVSSLMLFAGSLISCTGGNSVAADPDVIAISAPESGVPTFYIATSSGLAFYNNVINLRIEQCMSEQGFEYVWEHSSVVQNAGGRFGLEGTERARRFGYGSDDTGSELTPDPSLEALVAVQPPEYWAALQGDQDDWILSTLTLADGGTTELAEASGCGGRASEAVFGSRRAALEFRTSYARLEDFYNRTAAELHNSDAMASLNGEWQRCMEETHGLAQFAAPLDAATHAWSQPRPSAFELQVAAADVDCKSRTDYLERAWSAERVILEDDYDNSALADVEVLEAGMDLLRELAAADATP